MSAEAPPFESFNADAVAPLMVLCDHATNIVPLSVNGGDLGLTADEMARHIAYDPGAFGVARALAATLDAPMLSTRFSRLVIDPNRGEDDPTLVMRLYDATIIPANRRIDAAEVARRLDAFHRPYHAAIEAAAQRLAGMGRDPALISIHSYTPKLVNGLPRPWHVGVLWRHDGRIALPLLDRLRAEPDLCVGENEPYDGQLEGDTLSRHGTRRNRRHVLIELRQDLIETAADQRHWATRLAPMIAAVVNETETKEAVNG